MFFDIYINELRKNFKSIAFYLFTGLIIYGIYLFVVNTQPGVVFMGVSYSKEWHNAPIIIAKLFTNLSVFGALITMIIIGRTVTKDFNVKIHDFFFPLPVSITSYVGGRFLGGVTANLLIFSGVVFGVVLGCLKLKPEYYGPFQISAYLLPVLIMLIPNLLLIGSIFFSLATLSRRMVLTYVSGVLFLMVYGATLGGFSKIESDVIRILLDPFGTQALILLTKYWTVAEINVNSIPLDRLLILNRVIWLSVSFLILYFTHKKFKFISVIEKKEKKKLDLTTFTDSKVIKNLGVTSISNLDYSFIFDIKKLIYLIWVESKRIVLHPAFIILTFAAMSEIVTNFTSTFS